MPASALLMDFATQESHLILRGPRRRHGRAGRRVGLALTATSDAIVSAAPPEKAGSASSVSETAFELGTGLGIAVLGSVLAALYTGGLPAGLSGESLAETLATAPTAEAAAPAKATFDQALVHTATISAACWRWPRWSPRACSAARRPADEPWLLDREPSRNGVAPAGSAS